MSGRTAVDRRNGLLNSDRPLVRLLVFRTTLPEFDVTIVTVRSGTQIIRIEAEDAHAARSLVQADGGDKGCHCPPDWCTDDVSSDVSEVRLVVLDGVTLISADGVAPGTLYGDDSLRCREGAPG